MRRDSYAMLFFNIGEEDNNRQAKPYQSQNYRIHVLCNGFAYSKRSADYRSCY